MKKLEALLIATSLFSSLSALAAPQKFTCSAQTIAPNQPPMDCQISADPLDSSTIGNRPGSIDTNIFAGTLTVSCDGYAKSFSGVYPLWEQPTMASEAVSDAQNVANDNYVQTHFRPLAFDAKSAASGTYYAGGPNGSVLVFFVNELKDSQGQVVGHTISSTLGYTVGCVK